MADPAVKGAFANLKQLSREVFQILRLSSLVSQDTRMPPMVARQLEVFVARKDISEAGILADFMAILGQSSYEDKLRMLAAVPIITRLQRANELLQKQISSLQGSTKIITITNTSQNGIDEERMRELQKLNLPRNDISSLLRGRIPPSMGRMPGSSGGIPGMPGQGGEDDEGNEIADLEKRLHEANMSPEAQKVAAREIKRMKKMNPQMAEVNVIRNYLETLAEIPWSKMTEDKLDNTFLTRARKQLDDDHYGLDKVKKRLLEYLAVLRLKQQANAALEEQIKALTSKEQEKNETAVDADAEGDAADAKEQTPPKESEEVQTLKRKRMTDKSPILLLQGPPGVGKTSLAKSIATALGRKFHRISLGGVRDEAEIRGHRRTYVAAMPGLIISGLRKVGVNNPVILLDEIDKISQSNHHGDPSAAMLEVLDPEQNYTFNDHYVNIPVDLSKVIFIATANNLETIPAPLLDRMEMINLAGYTTLEKRHIATRHLIPKQISTNGLDIGDVQLPDDVVDRIITGYTRESGVRNLEREIGSVCRYKAVQFSEAKNATTTEQVPSSSSTSTALAPYNPSVSLTDLDTILGIERFEDELAATSLPRPGVVTGLVAYSGLGQGGVLFIEILDMPGKGRVQLTGKLGDVLKESVEVALSWVKAHAFTLGLTHDAQEDIMANRSIHVHCPAGAVPKDGPSAGLAHTMALVSLFAGKAVPQTLAMTGEVSLRGKVTPVGGIKEKLIGALRAGVKTVMLPQGNRKDTRDLPEEVVQGLEIVFVGHIFEALRLVWPGESERWGEGVWEVESRL